MNIRTQRQEWHDVTRYIIYTDEGTVQLELFNHNNTMYGGTAYIYNLWVNEGARRQGIAKALMQRAEDIAKENGHKSVLLCWNKLDTPKAILQWYKSLGYNYNQSDKGVSVMRKWL
jgi:ribosomal protein S18 acetylase RimI-like enzyme